MSGKGYERPDHYTRKAKAQGYAARSVFKLEELDERFRLLRPNQAVVDLGCYPGSWSRYVAQRIGDGVLVGVDLDAPGGIRGTFLARSVFELTPEELRAALGRPADLVLSDMAPATTGDRFGDHVRQIALVERALWLASETLRPGGTFVAKIFDGQDAPAVMKSLQAQFGAVRRLKPDATRARSVEFFAVAQDFRGAGPGQPP